MQKLQYKTTMTERMKALIKRPDAANLSPSNGLNSAPTLSLKKVTISYNDVIAIEDANLDIPAGKITALVGPSGCGKSSLLASINRMTDTIPHCKVSGQIMLGDEDIFQTNMDLSRLRRRVGMVFQQPNPFPLSIEENIRFPLKEHGIRSEHNLNEITETVLKQVGLWQEVKDRLKKNALQLSGGQQQRLCIARCLALKPAVILFDEPCSALDPISSSTVEELIKQLRLDYTVLMVTHNLAQARRIADHVAVCWVQSGCGCIIESGDTESIFERSIHPITRAFCQGDRG
ncbi:MAG: phosphate ABC transporter ATP-binding protein [Thiohalomonadales bacterium]